MFKHYHNLMAKNKTIELFDKIFGEWFKNILLVILLIPTIMLLTWGVLNELIGKEFAMNLIFLLIGIFVGKWIEK